MIRRGKFLAIPVLVLSFLFVASKVPGFQWAGEIYSHLPNCNSGVALTFDDGPSREYTPRYLQFLAENKVTGTFFLSGNRIAGQEPLVQEILKWGELGNHGYTHKEMLFRSWDDLKTEIEQTDKLIRNLGGGRNPLFRAPYGQKFLILPWVLSELGKVHVLFSRLGSDWQNIRGGDIVLFHDVGPGDLEFLRKSLESIQAKGLKVVSLEEVIANKGCD